MSAGETHRAIDAIFRIERARLIAGLARVVRDVDLAEELAQDALVIALSEWPRTGVPANPGAWLMTAAKRRAIDAIRRDRMRERKHEEIARELDGAHDNAAEAIEAAMDVDLGDELLGLIFTACHPILSADARAALTLRVIGGLTADEIARAFLTSEATIAQRIVRAKKTIGKAGLTFEAPRGPERAARLPSVLEVIYLIFNEGYAATAGDDLVRPSLCLEAQRLGPHAGRVDAGGRRSVRPAGADGNPGVAAQGAHWAGRRALDPDRAESHTLGSTAHPPRPGCTGPRRRSRGRWLLCAASRACSLPGARTPSRRHRLAPHLRFLRSLRAVLPSPVVDLNRAVAYSMPFGPEAGLRLIDEIADAAALRNYAPLPAARGDFLFRAGRLAEARSEFEAAAKLTRNARERAFLLARAEACD